jgi:hypothetical protein
VSYVNAPQLAAERGLEVRETSTVTSHDFVNLITLRSGDHAVAGTLSGSHSEPRLVMVDDHAVEVPPAPHMVVVRNDDRAGSIRVAHSSALLMTRSSTAQPSIRHGICWPTSLSGSGRLDSNCTPTMTKIVYCQDTKRQGEAEHASFDFLGYTFRGRWAKGKRGAFTNFSPAMSTAAKEAKSQQIREWHLIRWSGSDLSSVAEEINPQVRGWINYYGVFYRSELYFLARRINEHLVRWAMPKFKRLKNRPVRAWAWLNAVIRREPRLFAHWWLISSPNGRPVGAG